MARTYRSDEFARALVDSGIVAGPLDDIQSITITAIAGEPLRIKVQRFATPERARSIAEIITLAGYPQETVHSVNPDAVDQPG